MKRSHMLSEINLLIEECLNKDKFTIKETSECVLDFIEDLGMLPPIYARLYGEGTGYESIHQVREWEDE